MVSASFALKAPVILGADRKKAPVILEAHRNTCESWLA